MLQEVGRLSNDDDDDSKKVDKKKKNLRPFKLYCVYLNSLNLSNVGDFFCGVEFLRTLSRIKKKNSRRMFTSCIKRRIIRFCDVVVQWTSKKCTRKRDARAELLFCT